MNIVLLIVGAVLVLLGLHWIGQGTGIFIWPSNPIMNNHVAWAYYGMACAVAGIVVIWYSRRSAK